MRAPSTCHEPSDSATRVTCFHHAGGSQASFLRWRAAFPGLVVEAVFLERPGAGSRPTIESLADEFLHSGQDIAPTLYGHSMGALVAFEVAWQLRDSALRPERVILGAPPYPRPGWATPKVPEHPVPYVATRIAAGMQRVKRYEPGARTLDLPIHVISADLDCMVPAGESKRWVRHGGRGSTHHRLTEGEHLFHQRPSRHFTALVDDIVRRGGSRQP